MCASTLNTFNFLWGKWVIPYVYESWQWLGYYVISALRKYFCAWAIRSLPVLILYLEILQAEQRYSSDSSALITKGGIQAYQIYKCQHYFLSQNGPNWHMSLRNVLLHVCYYTCSTTHVKKWTRLPSVLSRLSDMEMSLLLQTSDINHLCQEANTRKTDLRLTELHWIPHWISTGQGRTACEMGQRLISNFLTLQNSVQQGRSGKIMRVKPSMPLRVFLSWLLWNPQWIISGH